MKQFAERFYKSKEWQACRQSYIGKRMLIDSGLCEECHKEQGYIVHHKIILTESNINNPNITLNHDYLEYVCKRCHDEFEGHGIGKKRKPLSVAFDENGQPINRISKPTDRPHS